MTEVKTCSKCKTEKPISEFFRSCESSDGRRSQCKLCMKAVKQKWSTRCADKIRQRTRQWRVAHRDQVKAYMQKWRTDHVKEIQAYSKRRHIEYYKKHGDRIRQKSLEWGREHKLEAQECARKYREKYREKCQEKIRQWGREHPAQKRESTQRWRSGHPSKIRKYNQDHRARKNVAEGSFSEEEWQILCNSYGNKCLAGHRTDIPLTRDHIIPMGPPFFGTNFIWNIQPLCQPCNSKKRRRIDDYRFDHRFERVV